MNPSSRLIQQVALVLVVALAGLFAATHAIADDQRDFFKAVELNRPDLIKNLLRKGVNPNITDPYKGNTALIVAMQEEAMDAFRLLVNIKGIDLNKRAKNGNSPLMMAAWKSNDEAVKMLLDNGAKVNQPGWTALHYAASAGNEKIVNMLLAKKADVNAPAPNKTTPMMMAAKNGHGNVVQILLDHGADILLTNEWSMSAVDFARDGGFTSLQEDLQTIWEKEIAKAAMSE